MERDKPRTMMTIGGRRLDPLDPDPTLIDIEDIAWSLSMQCRYNGHIHYFYSVAQHSVLLSMLCRPEHQLRGLLHDASEAYLGDVVAPVKKHLPEYQRLEERWHNAIRERFGFDPEMINIVKEHKALTAMEVRDLRPAGALLPEEEARCIAGWGPIEPWAPMTARYVFLDRFYNLGGE